MLIGQDIHLVPFDAADISNLREYVLSTNSLEQYASENIMPIVYTAVPESYGLECRGWSVERFIPGEKYDLICDDTKDHQSIVSVKLFLNKDYEGGIINFVNHDTIYSPSEGDVLIFPSSYINTYSISEISSGEMLVLCGYFKYRQTAEG